MKQNNVSWVIIAALLFTLWLVFTGRIEIPQPQPTVAAVEPVYAQPTAAPEQPAAIIQAPTTFTPEPRPLAIEIIAPVGTTAPHLGQGCKRDIPCPGVMP